VKCFFRPFLFCQAIFSPKRIGRYRDPVEFFARAFRSERHLKAFGPQRTIDIIIYYFPATFTTGTFDSCG